MLREEILKLHGPKNHKIRNSHLTREAYNYLRKNKWFGQFKSFDIYTFYKIIRMINQELRVKLSKGEDVKFPCRMGKLEVRKVETYVKLIDGKLVTNRVIDWDKTLNLWEQDDESRKLKVLIRRCGKEQFKIIYNKSKADFINKQVYSFKVNRELKLMLRDNIEAGIIDAFLLYDKT